MNIIIPKYLLESKVFIDRSGLSRSDHIAAVNHLIKGLKWANLWDRSVGIYPMIGETKTLHTFNLVSTSFDLTWQNDSGIVHNWEGATGDGTSGQAIAMQNQYLEERMFFAAYIRRNNSAGSQAYMGSFYGTNGLYLGRTNAGANDSSATGETTFTGCTSVRAATVGLISTGRLSNTDARLYRNGIQIASNGATASFTPDTRNCYIFARYGDTWTTATISFFFFGKNFNSNDDHVNLYKIVQQCQQILGRSV